MPTEQPTYTAFFKLLPNLATPTRDAAEKRVAQFLSEYRAERISSFGYTFFDEPKDIITLWNALKRVTDNEFHMALIRHANLGTTALPSDLSPQILALPKASLPELQKEIQTFFETVP